MTGSVLWDTENDCEASNWDGTTPRVIDGMAYVKELGCNCDPTNGAGCGGCVDRIEEHVIGTRFIWKPNAPAHLPGKGTITWTLHNNMNPVIVHFVLKRHWYAEMLAGRKDIEYRAITPYWTARLTRRPVTHAAFSRGYTARGRFVRPVTHIDIGSCPYPGWTGDFYRVHLGPIMHDRVHASERSGDSVQ